MTALEKARGGQLDRALTRGKRNERLVGDVEANAES